MRGLLAIGWGFSLLLFLGMGEDAAAPGGFRKTSRVCLVLYRPVKGHGHVPDSGQY